jgi:hypothetical protein
MLAPLHAPGPLEQHGVDVELLLELSIAARALLRLGVAIGKVRYELVEMTAEAAFLYGSSVRHCFAPRPNLPSSQRDTFESADSLP